LNHSTEYTAMLFLALIEYFVEWFFFPQMKVRAHHIPLFLILWCSIYLVSTSYIYIIE
jgi:hypothetical protein